MMNAGPNTPRRCQNGFSLQELVVSVGVATLLAGLLLPVVGRAKQRAHRTQCLNNLRQMAQAFNAYALEHDRTLPFTPGYNTGWIRYLKEKHSFTDQMLLCPTCNPNQAGGFGDVRRPWRTGDGSMADAASAYASPDPRMMADAISGLNPRDVRLARWARSPSFYALKAGNHGPDKKAEFTLPLVGCRGQGSTATLLLMCENVRPSTFSLKIAQARTGRSLENIPNVSVGREPPLPRARPAANGVCPPPRPTDKKWEIFEWSGPLAIALGGEGSMLGPQQPFHRVPMGFGEATFRGRGRLCNGGVCHPRPPSGSGRVNYTFLRTTLKSSTNMVLRLSLTGDDAYSAFVLKGGCCSGGPGSPCDYGPPATSTYGINAWAQSHHPTAAYGSRTTRFFDTLEMADSSTPVFTESVWADLMPETDNRVPSSFNGGRTGMSRAFMSRHGRAVNASFADGSARTVPLRELWRLPWHRDWRSPKQ